MEQDPNRPLLEKTLEAEQATRAARETRQAAQDSAESSASDELELPAFKRLERLEAAVDAIRVHVETLARTRQYYDFSIARAMGIGAQLVVLGFAVFALADYVYGAAAGKIIVKLMFAGVFQLGALTAFVLDRGRG